MVGLLVPTPRVIQIVIEVLIEVYIKAPHRVSHSIELLFIFGVRIVRFIKPNLVSFHLLDHIIKYLLSVNFFTLLFHFQDISFFSRLLDN